MTNAYSDTLKGSVMNIETNGNVKDKHLLIAIDQTENSKHAVLYVAEFLGGFPGFKVTLLSIIQEPEEDFFENEQEQGVWTKNKQEETNRMLENYRQVLIQSGFPEEKVGIKLCIGDAKSLSEMILSFQCNMNCCTVVVGRHHKSKTEEFLFGSISNQLIHEANNCTVWVVE
ncbi:MAG: universal stress protein [Nitrospirae bacterium]|nr:universal stress protein [Nitrospirota bacterium]